MKIKISPKVDKYLRETKKKDFKLFAKITKQLFVFESDPKHPSLRTHKLSGNLKNTWSISVDRKLRIVYTMDSENILIFDIGTHDEIYRK